MRDASTCEFAKATSPSHNGKTASLRQPSEKTATERANPSRQGTVAPASDRWRGREAACHKGGARERNELNRFNELTYTRTSPRDHPSLKQRKLTQTTLHKTCAHNCSDCVECGRYVQPIRAQYTKTINRRIHTITGASRRIIRITAKPQTERDKNRW